MVCLTLAVKPFRRTLHEIGVRHTKQYVCVDYMT